MTWKTITLWDILTESKILSNDPDTDRRITVRLNCGWVEKRSLRNDKSWATKYYIRKKWQFIYGQQNLHNGAFGIIPEELDWYESSWDLPTFDIDSSCKPERLVYFLKQWWFYRWLSRIAKWIWSRRIYPEQLFKIEIPLPSIEEQEKIIKTIKQWLDTGSKLDIITYDNWDLVKRLRQSILQDAIQGKLVPQDPNDEPASELLKKIKTEKEQLTKEKKIKKGKDFALITKEEEKINLPQGWTLCRLGEILAMIYGSWLKKEDTISDWKYSVFGSNWISWYYNDYLTEKRAIIIWRKGSAWALNISENPSWTTDVAYYTEEQKYMNFYFTYYLLKSLKLESLSKGIKPWLSRSDAYELMVLLPPLAEQNRIVTKLEELMWFCDNLEKQISEAKENWEKLMESVLGEVFK